MIALARAVNDPDVREAIEADLLKIGLRLRNCDWDDPNADFTPRDLWCFVRQASPASAMAVQQHGARALWTQEAELLVVVAWKLDQLMWSLGGGKGPAPERPTTPYSDPVNDDTTMGTAAVELDDEAGLAELHALIGWD